MSDWNMVAYDNFYNALKEGQPASYVKSAAESYEGGKYLPYYENALSQWKSEQPTTSSSSSSSSSSDQEESPMTFSTSDTTPETEITALPELQLPALEMSEGASVVNQFNELREKDSLLKQQAIVDAHEKGVASGAIHGSQQAGAAERAIEDALMPLATAEANLVATEDISNWTNQTNQALEVYEKQYAERLVDKGIERDLAVAMAGANTRLNESLMSSVTTLMNNPDIEFGSEVKNKLVDILNAAQDNNNLILDMGFTY